MYERLLCEAGILKASPTLSWQRLAVSFFCVLFIQLGQHVVNSWGNASFLSSGCLCHK
ncbi:hypothetical protein LEMLEM_LOCUS24961, partial [Lemmus lemmus]